MIVKRIIKHSLWAIMSLFLTGFMIAIAIIVYFELQLPNPNVLKDIQLQVPLKIYTSDGKLIAQYGKERRSPIPLEKVPKQLIQAVLATEDARYFDHAGVDLRGLVRAAYELLTTGKKAQGGSTITMQVARNFFLKRKKTYVRKIKEILLAIKIDHEFSKDRILELYLNKIYFGNGAYGIASAAEVYYGKPLNQLSLPQLAMLAGLPKAPSAINPLANKKAAKDRRDHVLERMCERAYISKQTLAAAIATPLTATYHGQPIAVKASYVAAMVRDAMVAHFGKSAYTQGYQVYTTISAADQKAANQAVKKALLAYDKRHGYRGAIENLGAFAGQQSVSDWLEQLDPMRTMNGLYAAAITKVHAQSAQALMSDGQMVTIPWEGLSWAKREIKNHAWGPAPKEASDVVKVGDVVRVMKVNKSDNDDNAYWQLVQLPQAEGALVSLDPNNGAILALVGGFDYYLSNFNRVTQAQRQPGSSFKPFIYAAALTKGYTLASIINDAPVVVNDPSEETLWRPQNDTRRFYGPTRLRIGLTRSRNLVSIRLLENIGPAYAVKYAAGFGFDPKRLPKSLSLALGSAVVSPLELATGYAVFANGGYRITPFLIARIVDGDDGKLIYKANPKIACESCVNADANNNDGNNGGNNNIPLARQALRVITPQVAYLVTQAMRDVIKHGTGRAALVLKRPDLAGKTGTTNNQFDAWFSGFNSDIVTTAWVGFDQPRSLYEYGAQAALPMWIDFMRVALADKPERTMQQPPSIVSVRIDPKTGLLARDGQKDAIFELFRRPYAPTQTAPSDSMPASRFGAGSDASINSYVNHSGFNHHYSRHPSDQQAEQPLF